MMSLRTAGHLLLLLLVLDTLPCELTIEADHGDQEAVVVCTLLDHRPDWLASSSISHQVRHHAVTVAVKRAAQISFGGAARIFSLPIVWPGE